MWSLNYHSVKGTLNELMLTNTHKGWDIEEINLNWQLKFLRITLFLAITCVNIITDKIWAPVYWYMHTIELCTVVDNFSP